MNIDNHLRNANAYLEMAKDKVSAEDFVSAQAALAVAYAHTRELLVHVNSLVSLKAEVERCTEEGPE